MQAALLPDRGVIKLGGKDARKFLNGLMTADIGKVTERSPRFAALLTPQGKIIGDFIVAQGAGDALYLDCPKALVATLTERLAFYKLRAKIEVADLSDSLRILAIWNGEAPANLRPQSYRFMNETSPLTAWPAGWTAA